MKNKKLLSSYDINRIRAATKHSVFQYGHPEMCYVLRKTFCRSCGEDMPKGTEAIKTYIDLNGSGSFTLTPCYIHSDTCKVASTGNFASNF
jgi:hypothetical protein